LRDAKLERANLAGADLRFCRLEGANLLRANLDGALIYREALGSRLLQEDREQYLAYVQDDRRLLDFALATTPTPSRTRAHLYPLSGVPWVAPPDESAVSEQHAQQRLVEAREIYRTLRAVFEQQGRDSDASWAHVRARKVERKSLFPAEARRAYARPDGRMAGALSDVNHLMRWLRESCYGAVAGYGERPTRSFGSIVVIAVLFTGIYVTVGDFGQTEAHPKFSQALIFSLASIVAVTFGDLPAADDVTKLLSALEASLGLALFAVFVLTLGNRMGRR
jgi:hypothetical protein